MSCEEDVRRAIEKAVAERGDGEQPCKYGNCVEFVDEQTGEVWGGFGPADCPCGDEWEED